MNTPLAAAAALSTLIACIHTFAGSRMDVRPLLASSTPETAKSTTFYCWHLVTITLFAIAGLFAWSAWSPDEPASAVIATGFSAAFALWGFGAAALRRRSMVKELPQGLMFLLPTGVGLWGLLAA